MAIRLLGDIDNAAKYLSWAKSKLRALKMHLTLFGAPMGSRRYVLDDAYIYINTHHGWDLISIYGIGGGFLIISNPGVDTTDYTTRKYYNQDGSEIQLKTGDKPPGWQLLDDGQYGFEGTVSPDDPLDPTAIYGYPSTDTGSLLVPCVFNGIAAVNKLGSKNYRFILNDTPEDEMFVAFTWNLGSYTYNFCQLDDSLIYSPYKYIGNKPFVSRYTQDGIVTATQMWKGKSGGILVFNAYLSAEWNDNTDIVTRVYFTPFTYKTGDVRPYAQINESGVCLSMTNSYQDQRHKQDVIRVHDFVEGTIQFPTGFNMLEPAKNEVYDIDNNTEVTGTELDRGTDNVTYMSYFLDGSNISGQVFVFPTITDDGLSTIQNDVIKPYALKEDGTMTYVRLQKDTDMTVWNCGLYVAGKLIEETGFLPVIRLFDTTIPPAMPPAVGPYLNGVPVFIRPVNYRILHAHHEPGWDVCVYRKTVTTSYENILTPYYVPRVDQSVSHDAQISQVTVNSVTTFWIVVNGVKTQITYTDINKKIQPRQSVNHENQLVVNNIQYSGLAMYEVTGGYLQQIPWVNIDDGSSNITRIFTSASQKHILIGFDVFNVGINHILAIDGSGNLTASYDTSVRPNFPPSSDGTYTFTSDRKWLLFDTGGNLSSDIPTPKFDSGGGVMKNVQRINTLCLLEE
jgi:hypothetical protein